MATDEQDGPIRLVHNCSTEADGPTGSFSSDMPLWLGPRKQGQSDAAAPPDTITITTRTASRLRANTLAPGFIFVLLL
jgi:hypothetical protein